MSERIVIVSGCRTAVGKFGGALKDLEATDLGGIVIKGAVKRSMGVWGRRPRTHLLQGWHR